MKPHFIDYTSSLRSPTKEQRQNAKSALKEIGRVIKDKRVIFIYTARECRRDRCATS